jgi:hypothetical protein
MLTPGPFGSIPSDVMTPHAAAFSVASFGRFDESLPPHEDITGRRSGKTKMQLFAERQASLCTSFW